jgi:hypothetical protein
MGGDDTSILVLENFHRYLSSAEIVQAMVSQLHAGKQSRSIIVVLAPVLELPSELEKMFVTIEHSLPGRDQLREIAKAIGVEDGELPEERELEQVLDAASGLTRAEAESAFSLSLVRHGKITPETTWELKTQTLKKSGLLELYRGDACFDDLGGLDALKSFCNRALTRSNDHVRAKGVMLLSPPGCGKSQICKALGNETGRPVILLNVGSLMGSLVGQTESRTKQALKIIDAMGKSVVLLDECDKAFGSAAGSSGDSGVSSRMFGTFLTWLNDRESDSFVVCTANDVQALPPEFARAERFDSVFFVDLPGDSEKELIWDQYIVAYGLDPGQAKPKDDSWTGAEIKACCRLSALLDVPLKQAAQNVVPVANTARESIDSLRSWASGRCIDAQRGGIYKQTTPKSKSRRRIKADPSLN